MKRRLAKGFTISELLIVIVVIGVLATIVLVGFSRYQSTARDSQRAANATVISEALEKYYDENGEYPSCDDIQDVVTDVTSTTLKGVDSAALKAPQAPAGETNSLKCTALTISGDDFFEYEGDGSAECTGNSSCLSYTLRYKEESTGEIAEIPSRRSALIATSGSTQLNLNSNSFTQASFTFTSVSNALNYELQRSTNSGFTSPYTYSFTSSPATATGLSTDTSYWFRMRPISATGAGGWSNTISLTTLNLAAPTASVVTNSSTAYTVSWPAITNANSYIVQCSLNGTTWGSGCEATTNSTSYQFTGASVGTRYYVRVQAVNTSATGGPYYSNWSNTPSTYTTVPAPVSYTISSSNPSWNTLRGTSNAVCVGGSTPQYQWYANSAVWSGATAQTVDYTLSWNQSVTIYATTRCTINGQYSSYTTSSNTASRSLSGPTAWAGNCAYRTACWDGSCPAGTTSSYIQWRVNSSSFGTVVSNAGVGYGTWANTGAAWGDGNVRSTTYCSGPWGTVTASGWGPFGAGCVPTINSGWCTV